MRVRETDLETRALLGGMWSGITIVTIYLMYKIRTLGDAILGFSQKTILLINDNLFPFCEGWGCLVPVYVLGFAYAAAFSLGIVILGFEIRSRVTASSDD